MINAGKRSLVSLKEIVSSVQVVALATLGFAAFADRMEKNVTKHAVRLVYSLENDNGCAKNQGSHNGCRK